MEYDAEAGVAVVRFEQAPDYDGVDHRPSLPHRELVRSTPLFDEFKRPRVACVLTVRSAVEARFSEHEGEMVFDFEWMADRRVLSFERGHIEIEVAALDLELAVTEEVVGYDRLRIGRGFGWESSHPWED